jgi:hypothetical protein
MRKRGVASPDVADAFILTMAEDAAVLAGGGGWGGGQTSWNEALPDRVQGVP